MARDLRRSRLSVHGVVQGVGFRPFVFDLATRLRLVGSVANTTDGVVIEVQGPAEQIDRFVSDLRRHAPPLAFVVGLDRHEMEVSESDTEMRILPSVHAARRTALLPPDVAVCDECLAELRDPSDRRYRYPFINCTNCGPRYTIVQDVPYDRARTTMAAFRMCGQCEAEYHDPTNRRFHAQPNACPSCGPRVWLAGVDGARMACGDPLREAGRRLAEGGIVAVKGLGGFHLAANAFDPAVIDRLRQRKRREAKPLALMCADIETAERLAHLDDTSRALLVSRHRPIVLVRKREGSDVADNVAPGNTHVGLMLPYTPVHWLLLGQSPPALVMTSGNVSEEPIAIGNDEALERLGGIADIFLLHDRDILVRNDDSVMQHAGGRPMFLRRSRGYVPLPVPLAGAVPPVLGVGAELKNTVCLTRGAMAFLSQHIGDQSNLAAYESFVETITRLKRILDVEPVCVAVDLHPDYMSTRWAEQQTLPVVRVQHHHAHVASCMAEHQRDGCVLGLALDGAGWGLDASIWGGELLVCDLRTFRRVGHLAKVRLPGGDQAVREPWRMAVSYLVHTFGDEWERRAPGAWLASLPKGMGAVAQLVRSGVASPWTSSCGRLFDAVAALCGFAQTARFEADAAMQLEWAASRALELGDSGVLEMHPQPIESCVVIDPADVIRSVVEQMTHGVGADRIALRFHRGLARGFANACGLVCGRTGLDTVALSGGVMQNRLFLGLLRAELRSIGLATIQNQKVPANDGGVALGQALVAAQRFTGT